jgi:hypothetical protein
MPQSTAIFRVVSLIIYSSVLFGCTTIHTTDKFESKSGTVKTLSIDAKQRVVLFTQRPSAAETTTVLMADGTTQKTVKKNESGYAVTCAEPSPDALSALSTSVGAGVQDPKVAVNLATAVSESAASIGLRTQSIQLLRDGMYRLCEGYAAGAIDGEEFNRQQRRYQNLMLSLLAIEQLTGAVVARQVGLGDGSAGASVGENADQAASDLTTANKAVADAQKALGDAQTTQANDEKTCKAAAPETTSPACGKASDDAQAVSDKQVALATATKKADTAKMALQAARSAVSASAAGAHVTISDATQTNRITDGTARYVAEATRTIVSTTLIASFAQEECTRLWEYLAKPESERTLFPNIAKEQSGAVAEFMQGLSDEGKRQVKEASEGLTTQELYENCKSAQQSLLSRASLFQPDYGSASQPLLVIGADAPISMPISGPAEDLRIVGGTLPYDPYVTPGLQADLEATIPHAKGAAVTVHIDRPAGATKTSGNATITIVDAANAHVEIPIVFAPAKTKTPESPPPASVPPPTKVTAKPGAGGNIIVAFTPPKSGSIDSFLATAIGPKAQTLTKDGPKDATSIEIPGCTAGQSYKVTVHSVSTSNSKSAESSPAASVTCGDTVLPPKPAPASPTGVKATAQPGQKLLVAFTAPKDDGNGAVQYSATATDNSSGTSVENTGATSPITLSNCKTGDLYSVQVVASRGASKSNPAKAEGTAKCQ